MHKLYKKGKDGKVYIINVLDHNDLYSGPGPGMGMDLSISSGGESAVTGSTFLPIDEMTENWEDIVENWEAIV